MTEQEIIKQLNLKKSKPLVYEKMIKFDEKVACGESITVIHFQYDTICNMNCVHCCVPKDKFIKNTSRVLNPTIIKDIFEQAHKMGLARADVSGGEPTTFKELDKIIEAIVPDRFWIQMETNGYLMTSEKAKHYKDIGIDKIQLSIDSLDEAAHDKFRRKPGSWKRAINAIDMIKNAGMSIAINTVVTHDRLYSKEFIMFLKFFKEINVPVNFCLAKPVGRWIENRKDLLIENDSEIIKNLSKIYDISDNVNLPAYGRIPGCFPFKRLTTITKYGDVLPCLHLQMTVGNIFDTPLKELIEKGMKYFEQYEPSCLSSNIDFINTYINKITDTSRPEPIENVLPLNWRELDKQRKLGETK